MKRTSKHYFNVPNAKKLPHIFSVYEKLNLIHQNTASYRSLKAPCCVGALLSKGNYHQGKNALAKSLRQQGFEYCNPAHILLMLMKCGVDRDPWGPNTWERRPSFVFDKLLKIEKLPLTYDTIYPLFANFHMADLIGADFTNSRFTYSRFGHADLRKSSFAVSKCLNCYFIKANMKKAYLKNAHFEDCDFAGANLQFAILRGAILKRCVFSGADLRFADFSNSIIVQADFAGAKNLHKAKLDNTRLISAFVTDEQALMLEERGFENFRLK